MKLTVSLLFFNPFSRKCSRLINHSCDPSANAKIIKVNGQSKVSHGRQAWGTLHANKRIKIVIYAERTLYPGEEVGGPLRYQREWRI